MYFGRVILTVIILLISPVVVLGQVPDHPFLWDVYDQYKISPPNSATLRHAELVDLLESIRADHPGVIKVRQVGESVEGRSINLVTIGTGAKKVLLWSQMHGNEPTATSALLDILNYMRHNLSDQFVRDILSQTTLLMIPMLNPDGAERYVRRNAQDIDINRDARYLQTPEGRTLKAVRDEYEPDFGFNLHDQGARNVVGRTGKVAAISLLTPPFDYEDNDNEVKVRAKKVAAAFLQSISPEAYGLVSKYDADFMPRAFGDMMQHWGVSTVLVESGGWTDIDRSILVKINFVGLLSAFHAIATDAYLDANPTLYDALRRTGAYPLFNLMISEVTVVNGRDMQPFIADIGINYRIRQTPEGQVVTDASIADFGDLRISGGKRRIDGTGLVCVPGFVVFDPGVEPGKLPSASSAKSLLERGVTTVLGSVDLNNRDGLEHMSERVKSDQPGISVGFLGSLSGFTSGLRESEQDNLVYGLTRPVLGVFPGTGDEKLREYVSWFNIPVLDSAALSKYNRTNTFLINDIPGISLETARKLGLENRKEICRGAAADLLMFEKDDRFEREGLLDFSKLRYIIQRGIIIYENGEFTQNPEGIVITR